MNKLHCSAAWNYIITSHGLQYQNKIQLLDLKTGELISMSFINIGQELLLQALHRFIKFVLNSFQPVASLNVRISSSKSKSAVYIFLSILQSMANSGRQGFLLQISTCCNIMQVVVNNNESFPASFLNEMKSVGTLYIYIFKLTLIKNDPKTTTQDTLKLNSDSTTQSPQTQKNPKPKEETKMGLKPLSF